MDTAQISHTSRCPNCLSHRVRTLVKVDSLSETLVTSDAQYLTDVRIERQLCLNCACISLVYEPADRLRRYFAGDYNIGDTVQNPPLVVDGRRVQKHDRVAEALWKGLPSELPSQGRWLEIACGRGDLSARFQAEHPDWECHALDPAPQAREALHRADPRIHFTKDFFSLRHYRDQNFDVIAAHGFLNRSPIWPELVKMRKLAHRGTILSLELLVLENSVFAPRIWDHSFMYLRPVLESYLAAAGFGIVQVTSCVTSLHVLAECTGPCRQRAPRPGVEVAVKTAEMMLRHEQWWQDVSAQCRNELQTGARTGAETMLYGAGLYNAVLLSMIGTTGISAIIDDTKAPGFFHGLPVISLEEAAVRGYRVLICSRQEYQEFMAGRVRKAGLIADVLGQEVAVG